MFFRPEIRYKRIYVEKIVNRIFCPINEGETATIDAYLIEISWAMYYLSMSIIGLVLAISTDTVCQ